MKISRQQGFTLLEVLVSITIASILISLLYSSLRIGSRSWNSSQQLSDNLSDMRIASQVIRYCIEHAHPMKEWQGKRKHLFFEGDNNRLTWVCDITSQFGLSGLYVATLAKRKQLDNLFIQFSPLQAYQEHNEHTEQSHIAQLSQQHVVLVIDYFGKKQRTDQEKWHADWEEMQTLPKLIKVNVTHDQQDWPDIVAQPIRSIFAPTNRVIKRSITKENKS